MEEDRNRQMVYRHGIYTDLADCTLCPRNCHANRIEKPSGYCHTGAGIPVASICIHRGEEPVISGKKGIINLFFAGCNLRCVFCQNYEISFYGKPESLKYGLYGKQPEIRDWSVREVADTIAEQLDAGYHAVGFVSPSHVAPQAVAVIRELHNRGYHPVIVWNTNAYEKAETIRMLDSLVDVYLPDFKYITPSVARELSDAEDYPLYAAATISEMYRQRGNRLHLSEDGTVQRGLIIRHLVIPGFIEESKKVLRFIAENISTGVYISLMSQYYPTPFTRGPVSLQRTLYEEEYETIKEEMYRLGFRNGWIQDIGSHFHYRPDFSREHPFE
ncbi:MAG TPA: radical SAM protein [Bacteroidales bacterium]|nr:radical SAM protein [Bacteroidales bacterium]